jgi:hypothetical protein
VKRRHLAGVGLLTLVGALVAAPPELTTAAWTVPQQAQGTLQAGTVMPPRSLNCTAGALQDARFTWTLPDGGLPRTGYEWTLTATTAGASSGGGTILDPEATGVTVPSGILTSGTSEFTLVAAGPGDWDSVPVKGEVTVVLSLLGIPVGTTCRILPT